LRLCAFARDIPNFRFGDFVGIALGDRDTPVKTSLVSFE
jgi:hypothetical protein